jgi:NAD(P)-dependent dehydrogenase (short-subunit alcohol dehydrogenase family)
VKLSGKTAIVTGAARGLGRAYARRLASLGAEVVALDVDIDGAKLFNESERDAEAEALDARIHDIQVDLTRRVEVDAAFERARALLGGIDILVNNAGGSLAPPERGAPSIMPEEDIRRVLDVNLMSTIYCCQAVTPDMKARGGGVIVNTSSIAGRIVAQVETISHYSIAKAAVTHFTRVLAAELGPFGIRVNCIAPGTILTGRVKVMVEKRGQAFEAEAEKVPLRRLGAPGDCAGVIEFLVTDLSQYVTGQCISVCGGAALTPA